jgi:hypothetical protein
MRPTTAIIFTVLLLAGCGETQPPEQGGVPFWAPSFIPPAPATTQASIPVDGAGGAYAADKSGIKAAPAQELFDPAYPKPSFVQPSQLGEIETQSSPEQSPTVYPTRGQAADATGSPTLYPPTGRFNTEPGNPSLYPRGPLAPSGFRGH